MGKISLWPFRYHFHLPLADVLVSYSDLVCISQHDYLGIIREEEIWFSRSFLPHVNNFIFYFFKRNVSTWIHSQYVLTPTKTNNFSDHDLHACCFNYTNMAMENNE